MTVRLSRQIAMGTGWMLPEWSAGPGSTRDLYGAATAHGYEGIQVPLPDLVAEARDAGLERVSGMTAIRAADEAPRAMRPWHDVDIESVNVHLGTGFESDNEAEALIEALLAAGEALGRPVFVETHRATVTQDPARTLRLVEAHPELRFCGDLSHWYTGVEMPYGDFDDKLARLGPVLERVRMLHGRISDPGCIQVAVTPDDDSTHVQHFRAMWSTILAAADTAGVDDIPFVVELLPAAINYARTVERDGARDEEVDRWTQADVLWEIVGSCLPGAPVKSP